MGDMSLHGFDYWPEQMTDFNQLYPHCAEPDPLEVFRNEFRHVLVTQYSTTPEQQWACLGPEKKGFWKSVAQRLPTMLHSEVHLRVAELFPSCLQSAV